MDEAPGSRDSLAQRIGEIMDQAETEVLQAARSPLRYAAREALDRDLRQIKDDVLRMGTLVEEAIRCAV